MAVDMLYRDLETKNTGLCKKSNKSFPWVMEHFIIGLDEMCLMSDAHGDLHVIAAADKKKHEKLLQDSRVSITIVRTVPWEGQLVQLSFLSRGRRLGSTTLTTGLSDMVVPLDLQSLQLKMHT